jgi:hypothetical protein
VCARGRRGRAAAADAPQPGRRRRCAAAAGPRSADAAAACAARRGARAHAPRRRAAPVSPPPPPPGPERRPHLGAWYACSPSWPAAPAAGAQDAIRARETPAAGCTPAPFACPAASGAAKCVTLASRPGERVRGRRRRQHARWCQPGALEWRAALWIARLPRPNERGGSGAGAGLSAWLPGRAVRLVPAGLAPLGPPAAPRRLQGRAGQPRSASRAAAAGWRRGVGRRGRPGGGGEGGGGR